MTDRVALIGKPLRRRHSEVMHNAAFAEFGIDARFELRELDSAELPGFAREARGADWLGFGVTAPHKREVMAQLDEVEPSARAIGAVNNTVRRDDGSLLGFNTDWLGFASAVRSELETDLAGARIVLAGAGGAAHAVAYACVQRGARSLTVGNRSGDGARRLAGHFASRTTEVAACGLEDEPFRDAVTAADLLVNATTVGMVDAGVPAEPELLPRGAAVFDLVYVPPETELLARARRRGLRSCNGAAMLVAQGVEAFRRWTGVDDVQRASAAMERAVRPLLESGGSEA